MIRARAGGMPTLGQLDVRRWWVLAVARSRAGWRRVMGSFLPTLQSALGAGAAWFIADELLGREAPIFAPIATWVALGFKTDRVPRKVAELGAGASLGVLIGEFFANWFAIGPVQVVVVVMVAAMVGRFLDRGELFTVQVAVNSIVILGMVWWQAELGGVQGRWIDALVGSGVAFVIAVLLPRDPVGRPRRYAANTISELARMLETLGRGLVAGDVEIRSDVKGQRRAFHDVAAGWEEALATAREVVGLNPSLWRYRAEVAELDRLFRLVRRARRSTDMIARQGLAMTEEVGRLPVVGELVADAARAAHSLAGSVRGWQRPERARALLVEVAARSGPADIPGEDWRPQALASVVRAVIVDLLQLTGLSQAQARSALADRSVRAEPDEADDATDARAESDDEASPLWG